ncbi:MAG TPA: hypothetical protein GXX30_00450 [Firmicutes bacterium]|nr:hypothetical protein [Candidatus Fermentithermobacillaceae bacterium]
MGATQPVRVPGTGLSRAAGFLRLMFWAIAYILLVPVVVLTVLWGAVTYFPEPTKRFLGPVFEAIVPASSSDLEARVKEEVSRHFSQVETEVTRLRDNISALEERLSLVEKSVSAQGAASKEDQTGESPGPQGISASEVSRVIAEKSRVFTALAALTTARVEYLQGNKGSALREVRLAQAVLGSTSGLSGEIDDMLSRAATEVSKDSPSAQDWLSLVWHRIFQEVAGDKTVESKTAKTE